MQQACYRVIFQKEDDEPGVLTKRKPTYSWIRAAESAEKAAEDVKSYFSTAIIISVEMTWSGS